MSGVDIQIDALRPHPRALDAGRNLANTSLWLTLGQDGRAVWGEYPSSSRYQVSLDAHATAVRCSCPSRRIPCKHALALALLANAGDVPRGEAPTWVAGWIAERDARADKAVEKKTAMKAEDLEAKQKRDDARRSRIDEGVEALDLWLQDLVRRGLSDVETQPRSMFEERAARLVDAQAPGLAGKVRALASIPGSTEDWPERMLASMGRIALLLRAWRRQDELAPLLREAVRRQVGWRLRKADVLADGPRLTDEWSVIALIEEEDEQLRSQRITLRGARTGRFASIRQYAFGSARFDETFAVDTRFEAELAFWPSTLLQRAVVARRLGPVVDGVGDLPGTTIAEMLSVVADALAVHPWAYWFPAVLASVIPVRDARDAWLVDEDLAAIRCSGAVDELLAVSGGRPIRVVGTWSGRRFYASSLVQAGGVRPLGAP